MIVDKKELAACLGVSQRRVAQLQRRRVIERTPAGYDLTDCTNRYIAYRVAGIRSRERRKQRAITQADRERARLEIVKAQLRGMLEALPAADDFREYRTGCVEAMP